MASPEARARQQVRAYGELNAEVIAFAESLGLEPPKVLVRHKDPNHVHTVRANALTDFFRALTGAVVSVEQTPEGETILRLNFNRDEEAGDGAEEQDLSEPEGTDEDLAPSPETAPLPSGATVAELVDAKTSEEEAAALKRSEAAKKAAATRAAQKAK